MYWSLFLLHVQITAKSQLAYPRGFGKHWKATKSPTTSQIFEHSRALKSTFLPIFDNGFCLRKNLKLVHYTLYTQRMECVEIEVSNKLDLQNSKAIYRQFESGYSLRMKTFWRAVAKVVEGGAADQYFMFHFISKSIYNLDGNQYNGSQPLTSNWSQSNVCHCQSVDHNKKYRRFYITISYHLTAQF